MKKGIIYISFFVILITVIIVFLSFSPHPVSQRGSPSPKKESGVGNLENVSFSQLKDGKKVWGLTAKSMEDKGDSVILFFVKGTGHAKKGEKFFFYADKIELSKKDYSFIATGNPSIEYMEKTIKGDKIIYNAKENIYTIFHGIIYINNKVSLSGKRIVFLPNLAKIMIGGEKDE